MYIIFGNYGNHTLAVMQWISETFSSEKVYVVSVDTGWAAEEWQQRVKAGEALAMRYGFETIRLFSKPDFSTLMRDRQEFPSTKFQWCAGFLKGLPLLNWLDERDPQCEAVVVMGKRRSDSRANFKLSEYIETSEYYGDRKVWYPLYDCADEAFTNLINKTGLIQLDHRSMECDPCVNSVGVDLMRIASNSIFKTSQLERELNKTMFSLPIEEMLQQARKNFNESAHKNKTQQRSNEMFDMGCGSPYGCGE